MLTEEQLDKWDEALRSGKYTQCRSTWATKTGHCCMDVLSIVVNGQSVYDDGNLPEKDRTFSIRQLIRNTPSIPNDQHLQNMNDAYCYTFEEIANEIKEHRDAHKRGL